MQWPETRGVPFLLIACALGITTTMWTGEAAAVPMRTVHDSKNVIAITVPTTWQIQSPSGRAALKATAPSSGSGLPDTVEVVVHIVPAEITTPLACENEAAWVTQHFGHITPVTVAKAPVTIGGVPAYSWTYTWQASTKEHRWSQQVCIVRQHTAYVVTGTTSNTPAARAARVPRLVQIIDSLRILTPKI